MLPNFTAFFDSLRLVQPAEITYRPAAGGEVALVAVKANELATQTTKIATIRTRQNDYLILAAELVVDDEQHVPKDGDLILQEIEGLVCTYKVLSSTGVPCWEWHDPGHKIRKVRCQQVSETAA